MKVKQLTSYPNPNELGMGNTNETYIRVENALDVSDIFPVNTDVVIRDSNTGKTYTLKAKIERNEFRINKLGQLYRDYKVMPGDEVKFTLVQVQEIKIVFFKVTNYHRVFLNVGTKGVEIVNIEYLTPFLTNSITREFVIPITEGYLVLKYQKSEKKRTDSPTETDFFSAEVNGVEISKGNYYINLGENQNILEGVKKNTVEDYFFSDEISEIPPKIDIEYPFQQIFYGAPGTGKSFSVEEICKKHTHFRTTFHPDSDYSTFVGCYKPKTRRAEPIYNKLQLIDKLSVIKNSGVSYPCHKFSAKYWESLKDLSGADIKEILVACGFTETMNVETAKGIAIGEELSKECKNTTISYEFVPQTFTNAYVEAWKDLSKPVFLVIEEINRGNCAQIFGDLFQLLDRKEDGFSSYQIHPDADLKDYIAGQGLTIEGVKDNDGNDISGKLMSGELMTLPKNLHIWATMNTSDQSLFPIDSAFKRRWDWEYVPIQYKNTDWKIALGNMRYSWVEFQETVNDLIFAATDSEDKQMGDYFVRADVNKVIGEDVLFNKIVFYLWNDVCKNGEGEIFKVKRDNEREAQNITFSKFLKGDRTRNLQDWMAYLEVKGENEDDPTL